MGDQQTLFLCILASGGFAAVLGGAFGALVGAVTWLNGRAAGTALGYWIAHGYEIAAGHELTPGKKGSLIGGADGAVFCGGLGIVVGAFVAWRMPEPWEVLAPLAVVATILLVSGALFGLLAFVLLRVGIRAVGPVFVGAMLGAIIGLALGHANGLMAGFILGLIIGTMAALFWWPRGS